MRIAWFSPLNPTSSLAQPSELCSHGQGAWDMDVKPLSPFAIGPQRKVGSALKATANKPADVVAGDSWYRLQASRSAFLTDTLLPHLSNTGSLRSGESVEGEFEIELFHDGFFRYRDYPTFHYLRAFERHRESPFDLFVYQVEDSVDSAFTRIHLGLHPGIVLFHDILFATKAPPTVSVPEERDDPLGWREMREASLPVFLHEWAHTEFLRTRQEPVSSALKGELSSFFLPFPASAPPLSAGHPEPRTVGFIGGTQIEGRAHKLLSAIRGLDFKLLWVVDNTARAEELCREYQIDQVEFVWGENPARWQEALQRISVAVHTRYSVYSSAAPYLQMSLMAGVPSIVTRFGAAEYLSDHLVLKIDAGDREAHQLRLGIQELLRVGRRRELAKSASESFSAEVVAEELKVIFRSAAPALQHLSSLSQQEEKKVRGELFSALLSRYIPGDERERMSRVFEELGWRERAPVGL